MVADGDPVGDDVAAGGRVRGGTLSLVPKDGCEEELEVGLRVSLVVGLRVP